MKKKPPTSFFKSEIVKIGKCLSRNGYVGYGFGVDSLIIEI